MPAFFELCNYWAGLETLRQHYLQPTLNQALGLLPPLGHLSRGPGISGSSACSTRLSPILF